MKLFIALTGLVATVAMQLPVANAAFSDVVNSPFATAINYVKQEGIVQGYTDGTFRPNQLINRAEFTKIIVGSIGANLQVGSSCFSDVQADDWFATYVCTAKNQNILSGNPDGTFKPAANINYAEAAKIIIEANGITTAPTSVWYERYTNALAARNASVSGAVAGSAITRGQMAQMIFALSNTTGSAADGDAMIKGEADGDVMIKSELEGDVMIKGELEADVMVKHDNVVELSDVSLTDGTTKLLFFNASWCPSCRADIALLNDLAVDNTFAFPVVLVDYDSETSLKAEYGVTLQHTYVLVDGQGQKIDKWINPSDDAVTTLVIEGV